MADIIELRRFGGEIPVSPPHLLPDYAAQQAQFCDFAHGHLMPLKQGFLLTTMSAAVKTIYTQDGINFYTWPFETWAFRSPVLQDTYNRVYFLDSSGVLQVTTTVGMTPTGGQPSSTYKVGVPAPTLAPGLAVVERTTLRDYPGATFTAKVWWESQGTQYQEADAALTTVTALKAFTFNASAKASDTPADAVVKAMISLKDGSGNPIFSLTLGVGDSDIRTLALPGGVTVALTLVSGSQYRFDLSYGVAETRAYTYTCVNTWKEESAPGPASQISVTYLEDVQVTLSAVDFTGYRPLSAYNLYRTMGTSPTYVLVRDADASTSFVDSSSKASDVLGTLQTLDYVLPPAQLDAMVAMPNGCFVGFHDNMLYISEPYRPHTWQYQKAFPKSIRGLCVAAQSVVVATAEFCYALVGSAPANMQPLKLSAQQAGIAQRSMVDTDGSTAVVTHDGVLQISGSQASMRASQALFARDDWQTRYGAILQDASMRLAFHDGCLVATSSTQALGFLIRFDGEDSGQYTQFNEQMDAMFQLPVADTLYYAKGANIYEFRAGSDYSYTWWSKDWTMSRPVNLGAGYIRCSAPVTLTVYADGAQVWTGSVSTGYFRLPAGFKALLWSVKLQGTATVEELVIAKTMGDLKRVE